MWGVYSLLWDTVYAFTIILLRLHLFDQQYIKNSYIVKYYYNLK